MRSTDQNWVSAACRWLGFSTNHEMPMGLLHQLGAADGPELESLLNVVSANFDELNSSAVRLRQFLQQVAVRVLALASDADRELPIIAPDILLRLSEMANPVDPRAAAHCLQMLAAQPDEESIDALAASLSEQPPEDFQSVGIALSPLWRLDGGLLEFFFDKLESGFFHPATMSALLDLANYAIRKGKLKQHPFGERVKELLSLLNSLNQRLRAMESNPRKFGDDVDTIQRVLGESVSLTISLCDALGLIGDASAAEILRETLGLSHRRVQCEAAGALARLRDAEGQERLIALAADPVARLRAVAYADELDLAEQIEDANKAPQALAESELANWLASGERFGIAPHQMELVDARSLYWPSYEEPRDCYLFRYSYISSQGQLSNIGIAGPLTCAFNADLANLPPDDIYAVFAGWQAEHEEIFEVPEPLLNIEQRRETDRLIRSLEDRDYQVKQVLALTFFLGEIALLAIVQHEGKKLYIVTDGFEHLSYPAVDQPTALTADLVLSIFRGRKLLRSFNH